MKFIKFDPEAVQSTLEYWTDERMANAIPMPLLPVERPERIQQTDDEFSQAETEMFLFGEVNRRFHPLYAAKVDVNSAPYNKAGKLFLTRPNGKNYSGTAQFVGADNIILTSAHSLKVPGGEWSTNVIFRRAYRGRVADQHLNVVASALGIHSEWDKANGVRFKNRVKWDYAFAQTTKPSNVGHLTLSTNLPDKLKSIGYPSNYGLKKKHMCEGRGIKGKIKNGRVKMLGNFMEGGASGGAWFERDGLNEVVGINAGSDDMGNVSGPVFDQQTINLMNAMVNKDSATQGNPT